MSVRPRRPAVPDLYAYDPEGRPVLLATRCHTCGGRAFPARVHCADCFGAELEQVQYGPTGEIYSFTFVHETFGRGSLPPPYGVARVRFEDGFIAQGLLDPAAAGWQVGMPVETAEIVLEQDGGDDLLTYAFRPMAVQERHNA